MNASDLESRLSRLETSNRRLRLLGVSAWSLVLCLLLSAAVRQDREPKELRVSKLTVEGKDGTATIEPGTIRLRGSKKAALQRSSDFKPGEIVFSFQPPEGDQGQTVVGAGGLLIETDTHGFSIPPAVGSQRQRTSLQPDGLQVEWIKRSAPRKTVTESAVLSHRRIEFSTVPNQGRPSVVLGLGGDK